MSFKAIRISVLLLILVAVLLHSYEQKRSTTSWYQSVEAVIYPINGDGSAETAGYISTLSAEDFRDIDRFFARQGAQYDLIASRPVVTRLGSEISQMPPVAPPGSNVLSVMWWSLKLRYWAWRHIPDASAGSGGIRLFVLFHQSVGSQPLQHSLGLQKGLIGIIHAYADPRQQSQNAIVIAHEILHTVGARDKYDANNLPLYPHGYGNPELHPLHPQHKAEIMAGRIAISTTEARMPASLDSAVVGDMTAREINWITP